MPLVEYDDIVKRITADMDKDAIIISGMYLDPTMQDKIRVTVIATGFVTEVEPQKLELVKTQKADLVSGKEFDSFIGSGAYEDFLPPRDRREDYRYNSEDLDVPTVIRDRSFINFPSENFGKVQSN